MIHLSPEAEAQLDALRDHFEEKVRPEAIRSLIAAVEDAIRRIEDDPGAGLTAPRPYPALARYGFRWVKSGAYWVAYTRSGAVITGIFYDQADIPKRLTRPYS